MGGPSCQAFSSWRMKRLMVSRSWSLAESRAISRCSIIALRPSSRCRARYRVSADGNIAVAAGGTAGAISVSLAITGEPLNSATAIVTPAAVGDLFNIHVMPRRVMMPLPSR